MSRVLGGPVGVGEVVGDGPIEGSQALPDGERCRDLISREQRAEHPVPDLGVEDREALPIGGEDIGVGVRNLSDQALEFQAAQVVAAASLVVRFAEQSTDQWPDGLVAEPADQVATDGQRAGQGP